MLDDRGNTAVYLLYAYARIRSIARTAGISREQIAEYVRSLPDGVLPLSHEREFKLAKQILKFSDCLLNVLEALQLHKLCDYIYALATTFHDFYKECYVINKNADGTTTIHYHRLVLCETTADVMDACFHILGITPVPRM
ncbi:arginyl aa-tRNA synthetase protein 1 b [Aphelenchoides avenae]|nr:arginyl aa-tRNA synthetase protein 1 b [Aphelenchus avenae]